MNPYILDNILKQTISGAEVSFLVNSFQKTFEHYMDTNYPVGKNSLMCSIHSSFHKENSHNCVACNLENSSLLIVHNLSTYPHFFRSDLVFPNFIHPLYLMVERMEVYIEFMELQRSIKEKNFKIFSTIKQWANFVKHPKAFMLVHHPHFIFDGFVIPSPSIKYKKMKDYEIQIDDDFVKEYYSGGAKNKKLIALLTKKEDVLVIYPNPLKLIIDFCEAQKYFVSLICENKVFQDLLSEKATKYYEQEDEKLLEENPIIS